MNLSVDEMELREKCLKMALNRHPTITNYSQGDINQKKSGNIVTDISLIFKEADKMIAFIKQEPHAS